MVQEVKMILQFNNSAICPKYYIVFISFPSLPLLMLFEPIEMYLPEKL